jgi:hypothetical protein
MLFVSKITPIFALLTFKEKEFAHQAFSLRPLSVGRAFCVFRKGEFIEGGDSVKQK